MPTQSMNLWDNPLYAWQQQLASGANLAKNLSPQALLGLTLGTGLGNWLGYKLGNWQRVRDGNLQHGKNPEINPVAVNTAVTNALFPRGDYDLGWTPPYQFQTAQQSLNDYFRPNPSSWNDWRQNFFTQRPTTPSPTKNPWGNKPLNVF